MDKVVASAAEVVAGIAAGSSLAVGRTVLVPHPARPGQ